VTLPFSLGGDGGRNGTLKGGMKGGDGFYFSGLMVDFISNPILPENVIGPLGQEKDKGIFFDQHALSQLFETKEDKHEYSLANDIRLIQDASHEVSEYLIKHPFASLKSGNGGVGGIGFEKKYPGSGGGGGGGMIYVASLSWNFSTPSSTITFDVSGGEGGDIIRHENTYCFKGGAGSGGLVIVKGLSNENKGQTKYLIEGGGSNQKNQRAIKGQVIRL